MHLRERRSIISLRVFFFAIKKENVIKSRQKSQALQMLPNSQKPAAIKRIKAQKVVFPFNSRHRFLHLDSCCEVLPPAQSSLMRVYGKQSFSPENLLRPCVCAPVCLATSSASFGNCFSLLSCDCMLSSEQLSLLPVHHCGKVT